MKLSLSQIKIKPDRQRKDLGDLNDLKNSLLQIGLINPIVVEPAEEPDTYYLVAGERRLTAWKALVEDPNQAWPNDIPATLFSSLDEPTRQLIELEENVKRKSLTWQEEVQAIERIYQLKDFQSAEEAAQYLGMSRTSVSRALQICASLGDSRVAQAQNLSAAYTIVQRENARAMDNMQSELNSFFKTSLTEDIINETRTTESSPGEVQSQPSEPESCESQSSPIAPEPSPYSIQHADFLKWVEGYHDEPFNLIHLDFPYGINHDRSQQGNTASYGAYEDSEDIYKTLVTGFLASQDKLVSEKAHCICWLSLRYEEWTRQQFLAHGWTCHMQPLIWHKTDNKGIIADTQCGFRNVGEYALYFIRGRKAVVKNTSNIFDSPCTKKFHVSEKPLPMLEHFFSALCDQYSRVLDPTCGSGTAIMAAASKGAKCALGLELDPDFASKAQEWLRAYLQDLEQPVDFGDLVI